MPSFAGMEEPTDRRPTAVPGLVLVAAMAALMWVSEIVDQLGGDLDRHGIQPRDAGGLEGVAAAPFLHVSFEHLIANTVPFLAFGAAIALGGAARVVAVTAIVAVVGGLGTWLTGPDDTNHVGASGVVFGYAAYLAVRGVYSRSIVQVLFGVIVLAVWGTTLLRGLVPADGISWQGHLFGAIGGVVAARLLHRRGRADVATGRLAAP